MMRTQIIILLLGITSCSVSSLSEEELKRYPLNPKNGLIQRIEKDNNILEMYYKPKSLIMAQELRGVTDLNEIKATQTRLDSLDYFVLRLSRNGQEIENSYASNSAHFSRVVDYLSFSIGQNLYLVTATDTVHITDAAYARSFGTAGNTNILLVFKSDLQRSQQDAVVYFNDPLFGTGLNRFEFKNEALQDIPNLTSN